MSTDPYHAVQSDIQASLQHASTLLASFRRIRSYGYSGSGSAGGMGSSTASEEVGYARAELKATISALDVDLDDLEESVNIVEQTGARLFNLDDAEVAKRRAYVNWARGEIQNMRLEIDASEPPPYTPSTSSTQPPHTTKPTRPPPLTSTSSTSTSTSTTSASTSTQPSRLKKPKEPNTNANTKTKTTSTVFAIDSDGEEEDDQAAWAREERQMLVRAQEQALDGISGTLSTLAEQAGMIGQEVGVHNEMLTDLESGVERTDSKLGSAMKKMRKFIRDTEETKSSWCIGILIAVLMVLLLAVILV